MKPNLQTTYLGLSLTNPLVVAACPLTGDLTMLRRLEEAGAGAAVLPSLFQEQIELQQQEICKLYDSPYDEEILAPGIAWDLSDYNSGPDSHLRRIELAKRAVQIPIIASVNGTHAGRWTKYARLMAEAGADALELNICFVPSDPLVSAQQLEDRAVELVAAVCEEAKIPVAVKIGPYYTAIPHLAARFVTAGAAGLVLFNRFLEPDIDVDLCRIEPRLTLSESRELRLPLRWIAILRDQLNISLAATSGIHHVRDVIKALMVGADVTMMAAAILRHGPNYLAAIKQELIEWLERNGHESLDQLRGSMSSGQLRDPSAIERANYLRVIASSAERTDWAERPVDVR